MATQNGNVELPPYEPERLPLEWNLQTITFAVSMIVQAVALGISIYALVDSRQSKPALLEVILILELVVQGVELAWYSVVGMLFYFGRMNIGVSYRYLDWAVTTPTMLISILLFIWYLQCNILTLENVLSDDWKVLALLTAVILNWVMLAIGYVYEAKLESITQNFDLLLGPKGGLYLAFVPFVGSYLPIFVSVAAKSDAIAWIVAILTFFIWALYGVVAILYSTPDGDAMKNTFYNVLDIISKNLAGITVGIVALMYTAADADLSMPLCNATAL